MRRWYIGHALISRILIAGLLLQASGPPRILSVAEAINNSVKYGDSLISVQGRLSASEEFTALEGEGCDVRINALKRPYVCAVSLRFRYGSADKDCSPELRNVLSSLRKIRYSREASRITVVLTGKLTLPPRVYVEYAPPPAVPGLPKGEYVQMGFGHMNGFPVELIVQDGRIISDHGTSSPKEAKEHQE